MTPQQKQIIRLITDNGGMITKKEVVENLGGHYHCGANNHLGAMLSRMVNSGFLIREKPGMFRINTMRKAEAKMVSQIENQTKLF